MRARAYKRVLVYLLIGASCAGGAVFGALSVTAASGAAAPSCSAGTTVQAGDGPVCGVTANGVTSYLGVPYAAPPVGNLRWQPPQPHAPWTGVLPATAYASECTQGPSRSTFVPPAGSEDCLYLNIWRPTNATGSGALPVMFHIHGGGLRAGNGEWDFTALANTRGVVVVSINYRLGIFGFLANRALGPHSGDYGLQDQQAALQWVRSNIRAFGGNPGNITVFGESGGGSSVCDLIASPTAKGLFQKALSTSGEYNGLFGVPGPDDPLEAQDCKSALPTENQADTLGASFASALGCHDPSQIAACLRAAAASDVMATARSGFEYGGQGTIGPTLNGLTLTKTLRQALVSGDVNRVPVIAGVGRDENLIAYPTTSSDYVAQVQAQYGPLAGRVLALYPLRQFYSPFVAFRTVVADSDVVCSALRTDEALARWMPVYGYEIDYGDAASPSFAGPSGEPNGSGHIAGWYIAGGLTLPATPDPNQQVLAQQEFAYVTNFAYTGQPTAPQTPPWPRFNTSQEVMSLAPGGESQIMSAAQISLDHNCQFWNAVAPSPRRRSRGNASQPDRRVHPHQHHTEARR